MSQHTPGPWEASPTAGHETHGQSSVYASNGRDVAIVYDGEANAALISAAPCLLEACQSALDFWSKPRPTFGCNDERKRELEATQAALRAAVSRATGGRP